MFPTWVWWTTIIVTIGHPAVRRLRRRPSAARALHEGGLVRTSPVYVGAGDPLRARRLGASPGSSTAPSSSPAGSPSTRCRSTTCSSSSSSWRSSPCPRQYQQTALLVGIVLALIFRGIFIAVGAAAINNFSWIFYLFGAFLIYTAVKLAKEGADGRGRVRGEPAHQVGRDGAAGDEGVPRREALTISRERQAADHADVHRDARARHDRPAVRARLDPGDLRPHPGALPGPDREHLRADGAAPAVLPDRRPARAAGLPVATAWRSCSASSASS